MVSVDENITASRGADSINAILEAAATNFANNGFGGARVDQIASDAGVNKATIYYRIGDKSALYTEVLRQVLVPIADQVAENVGKTGPVDERFKVYVTTISRNIIASRHFTPIILREIASHGKNLPKEVLEQMARIIGVLKTILDQGREQGIFCPVDLLQTHMMIIGAINFYVASGPVRKKVAESGMLPPEPTGADSYLQTGERIARIILDGIRINNNPQNTKQG